MYEDLLYFLSFGCLDHSAKKSPRYSTIVGWAKFVWYKRIEDDWLYVLSITYGLVNSRKLANSKSESWKSLYMVSQDFLDLFRSYILYHLSFIANVSYKSLFIFLFLIWHWIISRLAWSKPTKVEDKRLKLIKD